MPLDFPNNPTNGQTYTDSNITWQYDGEKWNILITGGPTYATSLPTSPVDGREIYYQASGDMETNGIVWHLRYRSAADGASPGSGAWEYVGGPPMFSENTSGTTRSGSTAWGPGNNSPSTPSITLPEAGDWNLDLFCSAVYPSSTTTTQVNTDIGISVNGADPARAAGHANWGTMQSTLPAVFSSLYLSERRTGLAKSAVLTVRFKISTTANNTSGNYGGRVIRATPSRLWST